MAIEPSSLQARSLLRARKRPATSMCFSLHQISSTPCLGEVPGPLCVLRAALANSAVKGFSDHSSYITARRRRILRARPVRGREASRETATHFPAGFSVFAVSKTRTE